MSDLTPQEIEWLRLTQESTAVLREKLLAHDTLDPKELYTLCNRVDALTWHLAQRRANSTILWSDTRDMS